MQQKTDLTNSDFEALMKKRGEEKILKDVRTKKGNLKNIASTQIGQQLLFEESLRVLPLIRNWIENDCAKIYRNELKDYFKDDEILLRKITETYLLLAGTLTDITNKSFVTRHKKIKTVENKILKGLSFEQCWRFIEINIYFSKYFFVEKLLHQTNHGYKWNLKYTCKLPETIVSKLSTDAAKAFYPLPMTQEPIDWGLVENIEVKDNIKFIKYYLKGGYKNYQYEFIRTRINSNLDYTRYHSNIFNVINYIQSVAWVINEPVLNQIKLDLKKPIKEDFIKIKFPDTQPPRWKYDINNNPDQLTKLEIDNIKKERIKFQDQVKLYNSEKTDFESALGKYRAVRLAINIAEDYIGKTIYFPHNYDFRGRIYPISIGLSPQGSDPIKAILLYKDKQDISNKGIQWNWAYLASLYGDDTLPFEQRVERGKELINTDYKQAEEPYQFLSHQMELQKWTHNPSYSPNTRIHLDACNSGSQFTSAITGDIDGCIATNVIPTFDNGKQVRQDAYALVVNKALQLIEDKLRAEKSKIDKEALTFFKELLVNHGRKVCKVPVMVSNYGGTAGGRAEILWNVFRELMVDKKWLTKKRAVQLSEIIGKSIIGVLTGGKAFEAYIHQMNNAIVRNDQSINWTTADQFYVQHVKNKELKAKQVSCVFPGARRQTTITKKVFSEKMSLIKMKSAISPNYIHSLDAELLRRVALKMQKQGILNSDWIHDSFGCHPNNVDVMLDIIKDEFRKLIRRQPLKLLDQQLRCQAPKNKRTLKELSKIKIPFLNGFDSQNGGLDVVVESEWFFS